MSSEISPILESEEEKREAFFYIWETLAISAHCSKSLSSYLEFAWMFAEDVYTCRFDKNQMNTIRFILQTRLLNVCALAHG